MAENLDWSCAEIPFVQKSSWICFRISSSSVGNNRSLQIRSFSEHRWKCKRTGNPSIGNFFTIPTSFMLNPADRFHLLSDEAYRLFLFLLCHSLSKPSYDSDCKPNVGHFFAKTLCLSCPMPSVGRLELMLYHKSSNICEFHSPVDFKLNVFSVKSFGSFIRMEWG